MFAHTLAKKGGKFTGESGHVENSEEKGKKGPFKYNSTCSNDTDCDKRNLTGLTCQSGLCL